MGNRKIIIFDLDDTLISERDYIESGFNIVSEEISNKFLLKKNIVKNVMNNYFKESSLNVFNKTLEFFNIEYDNIYIKKLIEIYRNHIPTIKLYDDAKEIIEYLVKNNYKLGIITDGYKKSQKNKIEVLNIEKYFEHIIITDELGREFWKPSEVPYRLMKEKFNCKYEDMIYVGDNIEKDFITANKLNIFTIHIIRENGIYKLKKNYFSKENNAQKIIYDLNKIREELL